MTIEEMKAKINELSTKEARIKERLAMTNEALEKQFGTTDPTALNELLEKNKQREADLSQQLKTKMEELSTILAGTNV